MIIDIAANLNEIRRVITEAATAVVRDPKTVTILAVSKTQPRATINKALAAGHRIFAENRVQEAKSKWPALQQSYPDLELHLIGPLQTNKVTEAIQLFDVIETIDRPKLAYALAKAPNGRLKRCFIELNSGEESQKAGVIPEEFPSFLALCRDSLTLPITGIMAIPPIDDDPSLHFALLADIARRHGLSEISMGMSADFALAIRFGATHVRIGTKIFGPRAKP